MSQAFTLIELQTPGPSPTMSASADPSTATALSTATSVAVVLPPFRSTTEFPRAPKPDQLPALYAACLQALQEANVARRIHKRRMEARKLVIAAIRLEISRVEQDLALEAGTRASLHAMNLRLVEALQEMDALVGDMDALVHEAHRVPRTSLGQLIDHLKAMIQRWRSLRLRLRQAMASLARNRQDGEL